jgi:hypothetical protein
MHEEFTEKRRVLTLFNEAYESTSIFIKTRKTAQRKKGENNET